MAKVLLVTDYAGNLHITPVGNKAFYTSRNKVVTDKQFKMKVLEEEEAYAFVEKNKGQDPEFVTVAGAQKAIASKELELAAKDDEIAKLKAELEAARKNQGGTGGAKDEESVNAADLVAKINAATTVDEAHSLVGDGETRKTVLDALTKKLAQLSKA